MRLGAMDSPVPFNAQLEKQFLAKNKLKEKLVQLIVY